MGGGGKFDAFFNVFCILGVFLGEFGILGGKSPQEIAEITLFGCVLEQLLWPTKPESS